MEAEKINIGDLVVVKKELQRFVALPEWGIVLEEAMIIPVEVPDENFEPIDSFIVFFPSEDSSLTIPKSCLRKITILEE